MTFEKLYKKVREAMLELRCNGLEKVGYGIQIELSIKSYQELVIERHGFGIELEADTPTERVNRGIIFGTPFVLTQDTDRVMIAKVFEVEE